MTNRTYLLAIATSALAGFAVGFGVKGDVATSAILSGGALFLAFTVIEQIIDTLVEKHIGKSA